LPPATVFPTRFRPFVIRSLLAAKCIAQAPPGVPVVLYRWRHTGSAVPVARRPPCCRPVAFV